jgi:carboxypeptidase C (cathepsin A)
MKNWIRDEHAMRSREPRLAAFVVTVVFSLPIILAAPSFVSAYQQPSAEVKDEEKAKTTSPEKPTAETPKNEMKEDEAPIATRHSVKLSDSRSLTYEAKVGSLPIRNATGDVEARIFFIAYTLDGVAEKTKRPLLFSFNGGPGSASLWLHLGAIGPKRVRLPDDATFPKPPFALEDNPHTWLAAADLVFIDPVGTGYSRASKPELTRKFHGVRGDIESIREFIRLYLTREGRWGSPVYLAGESYGTTRAAGLSDDLLDNGIAPSGIVLLSTVLNFQTIRFGPGNDLPFVLYLPSYTATAWYHKKLGPRLQGESVEKAVTEATSFAFDDYSQALAAGDTLSPERRAELIQRLAELTSLDADYVDRSNLRIELGRFCKELLRAERRTVGRLDSRYRGIDADHTGARFENDPSMAAIRAAYTSSFNQYIRAELGYRTDVPYYVLGEGVGPWDYGPEGGQGYADTSRALRDAMDKNPHLRVFIASGYYDLATPVAAADFTIAHMSLDKSMRERIGTQLYEAGHMMYVHTPSLEKLTRDVIGFIEDNAN